MRYITVGQVRGQCPHAHRTLSGAQSCLDRDRRGCTHQGGYSDRRVRHADGSALTFNESSDLFNLTVRQTRSDR